MVFMDCLTSCVLRVVVGTKAAHDPNNHARFMRYMVCQLFLRHDKQLVKNMGWKEAEKVVLSVLNQVMP